MKELNGGSMISGGNQTFAQIMGSTMEESRLLVFHVSDTQEGGDYTLWEKRLGWSVQE